MLEALERRNVPAARKAKKRRPQRVAPAPPPRPRPPAPAPPRRPTPPAPAPPRPQITPPQQQGVVAPDALRRALELSMAATAGDAEDDLQRALALSRAEAGIEAPPSAANPPVDLASALAAARAATAPEDELERALAASRADNDAALVAECRAVDAARIAAEADAETLAERRAAEERERETLVISGVGAAADAARNAIVASTDALAAALFERPALKSLFVDGGEAARRGVVKLLALGRSAAKWYPLHAPAVLRERATALEATVVAVDAEVEVLETALFAMPEDGRHGCVPRLFLGDAAEGVIDLSEAPEAPVAAAPNASEPVVAPQQPATLDTSQSDE